jgi:glucokinase
MPDAAPTLGIDLGGTKMLVAVVDARHRILGDCRRKTRATEGVGAVLDRIVDSAERACAAAGVRLGEIGAVGVGAPSAIDRTGGVVLQAVNLGWRDLPLREILRKRLQRPVVLDNDVNVAAYGEARLGAGRSIDDLLAVWVGTGVGGGLILGGRVHRGHFGTAGEIGHMLLDPTGPPGQRTVEEICSRTAIVHSLRRALAGRSDLPLARRLHESPQRSVGSGLIAEAFRSGDPTVRMVVEHAADRLGTTLASLATVLSPEAIVVGGGLSEALGKPWLARIRAAFLRGAFPDALRACKVLPSALGDNAGVVGAALLARAAIDPAKAPRGEREAKRS